MIKLRDILNEIKVNTPGNKYSYCWIDSHEDYHSLNIASKASYKRWLEDMAEDNETTIENVMKFEWADYLEEIPQLPIIFLSWNDEGVRVFAFKSKEQFVNSVGFEYWNFFDNDSINIDDRKYVNPDETLTAEGIVRGYNLLVNWIDDSEADGDSSSANMLIVNNKIIASGPYYTI
jgi:hypothetical protein